MVVGQILSFRVRAATAEDIPDIQGLIASSVRGLQTNDYTEPQREGALATAFTVDSQLIADGTYFVAFSEEGILAGCGGWSYRTTLYGGDARIGAAQPAVLDPARDAAKIRAIFVAPQFARHGLGSLLLETAEQAAIAMGFHRLEMGSTLTGVALYSLRGYREVDRLTIPVAGDESIEVVRMVKTMKTVTV